MTAADKIAEALTVHMVGIDLEPDDLPAGCVVVLTGSEEAVRAAAKMFGQQVRLTTDLADALAQENAKLRSRIEQLEGAVMTALVGRAVSKTKPCATPSPENAQ